MPIVPHRSQLARKSVAATLCGIAELRRRGYPILLDIFGAGDGIGRIARWIERYGLQDYVTLRGNVPNEEMIHTLSNYKALFLCSKPETFGLVYIEALKAGIPIVHMAGTGIDGVFPQRPIGVAVKSRSSRSLADAFVRMDDRYATYKDAVRELHGDGALEQFSSQSVQAQLREIYGQAVQWIANSDTIGNAHGTAACGIELDFSVEVKEAI
jgi:glycosyltransferase involved in cell wall biosynthesis